jgi:hypothetical protein
LAAINFNPAPEKSNQFPRKDHRVSYKMPDHIREALKKTIGYEYKKPEEKIRPVKVDWKKQIPGISDQDVVIYERFDELWKDQHCKLDQSNPRQQVVEIEGVNDPMTRGQFVHHVKKLIEKSNPQHL